MSQKEGTMAAIMAAVNLYQEEEAMAAAPRAGAGASQWKYWGLGEMMRMRVMWQLKTYAPTPLKRS